MKRYLAPLMGVALLAAACGGEAAPESSPAATTPAESPTAEGTAAADLRAACGDRIVIQTDWFPEAEHAAAYQLAGVGGEIDKEAGIYRNEIDDTGVTLEIRAGGPFVGFQPDVSLLHQDPEIDLAFADMDDAIQTWGKFPVKGLVSVMNKSPLMLMWDPETYQFETFADIGKSDATVLYFEGSDSYIRYLVSKGWLREDQLDASYDGSPARFVAERKIVQQGFVTAEPYMYEHMIEEWMKPVDYFLIFDSGYVFYPQMYATTPQKLEAKRDCFKLLVPMIQQAQVDYMRNPGPINEELVRIVDTLDTFWRISVPMNEEAHRLMLELGLVSNENNDTLGDYELDRVQTVIDQLKPIFEGLEGFDPNITPEDIVTNEFIDPSIGL